MSRSIESEKSSGPPAISPIEARISSSIEVHARRGSAAPASRRERSSRLSTSAREAPGLLLDHAGELLALIGRERGRADRIPGRRDRRERGAQVVRDGAQQRRLDRVRAPQGRRLDRPDEQVLALERGAEQRLQGRDDALLQAAQARLRGPGAHQQGPQPPRALAQRERDRALVALDRLHHDRRRAQLQRLRQARRRRRQGLLQGVAPQQQARHLGGEVGLAAALLGVPGACARRRRRPSSRAAPPRGT